MRQSVSTLDYTAYVQKQKIKIDVITLWNLHEIKASCFTPYLRIIFDYMQIWRYNNINDIRRLSSDRPSIFYSLA